MDLGRIKAYLARVDDEDFAVGELSDIDAAFRELVESGVELRDLPENAMVQDQLEELEEHASTVEKTIYEFFENKHGESYAQHMTWSTRDLAEKINQIPVIFGAEDSKLGFLLGELNK